MSTENLTMTDAFTVLLRKFNKLIENKPPISEIKAELAALREEAIIHPDLNGRQREAITERCDNYTNGTYGSWSVGYKVHTHTK